METAAITGHTSVIDFNDSRWMIELGRLSRSAERIVVRNFRPTPSSISFIKAISWQHYLVVSSDNESLVLEREPET